jgi:hypothetical protein
MKQEKILQNGSLLQRLRVLQERFLSHVMLPSACCRAIPSSAWQRSSPAGTLEIDPASCRVLKDGKPTDGLQNRGALIAAAIEDARALSAEKVLEKGSVNLEGVPLTFVYHNVIDKTGDARDSEGRTFEAVDDACGEIEKLVQILLRAGCGKVIVTADHGFLYQQQEPESYAYSDVPELF